MPSALPMPPELASVYLDFDWDNQALHRLDLPVEEIERAELDWHLDLPMWSSAPPAPLFDVIPRHVLEDPAAYAVHARRIEAADLSAPLHVMEHRGRLCVMDGLHRLARATREGRTLVLVRKVPRDNLRRRPMTGRPIPSRGAISMTPPGLAPSPVVSPTTAGPLWVWRSWPAGWPDRPPGDGR